MDSENYDLHQDCYIQFYPTRNGFLTKSNLNQGLGKGTLYPRTYRFFVLSVLAQLSNETKKWDYYMDVVLREEHQLCPIYCSSTIAIFY